MNTLLQRIVIGLACGLPILGAKSLVAQDHVRMRISSQETVVGVPVTLAIEVQDLDLSSAPQFPAIDGLTIQESGTPGHNSSISIINGRRFESRSTSYQYRITPHREGVFEVPAIPLESANAEVVSTQPFRISATKSDTGDLLFAEVVGQVDKLYVGQPIDVTLRVWLKPFQDKRSGTTMSQSDMFQLLVEHSDWGPFAPCLDRQASPENSVRGGEVLRSDRDGIQRSYYLYEMDATFYPKHAGQLDMGDVHLVAHYPMKLEPSRDPFASMFDDSMFGSSPFDDDFFARAGFSPFGRRLTVTQSRPIAISPEVAPIDVVPVPESNRPDDYRGAVGKYRIVTQATPTTVKAGDPITLSIGIQGTGPMELVQAPPLYNLSELTGDFKVSSDPLAGVVQNDVKVFSTTIRPRQEGISSIPSIPFSYFDPETEQFETVSSEPIGIQVERAETLSLDSITGGSPVNGSPASSQSNGVRPVLENRLGEHLLTSFDSRPRFGFWFPVLVSPLVLCGFFLLIRYRHRLTRSAQGVRATIGKISITHDGSQIAQALLSLSAYQLGIADNEVNRRSIVEKLAGVLDRPALEQLEDLLDQCERSVFANESDVSLEDLKRSALPLARQLADIPPGRRTSRMPFPSISRRTLMRASLATVAAAAVMWSGWIATRSAGSAASEIMETPIVTLTKQQQTTLLQEANQAYALGRKSMNDDAAIARESFATAAQKYQTLVDSGLHNPDLFFNLGNARLQSDNIGHAIANYRRALKLQPLDLNSHHNLEFAQARLGESHKNTEADLTSAFASWRDRATGMPPIIWLSILAVGWSGFCVCLIAKTNWPGLPTRLATVASLVLVFVATGWLTCATAGQQPLPVAVVVTNEIAVREGSSPAFPVASDMHLNEGQSVEVIQQRGEWIQIRDNDGRQGWVEANRLDAV